MAGTSESGWKIADTTWIKMQQKTFTKWCNLHLNKVGDVIDNLETDFENGLKLVNLAEVLSGEKVKTKVMKGPKLRIQKIQNIGAGLGIFQERIRLEGISAEDIVDGNLKLILGMIWTIIQKYDINDISEEELNAKDALLLWSSKKCKPYGIPVDNFHRSWKDGRAFLAIIHAHRPNLIPWETIKDASDAERLEFAFKVAHEELGIPRFLDVADMVDSEKPDERSVMTYVSQYYKYFAAGSKNDTAARRLKNLVEQQKKNQALMDEYATRSKELAAWIAAKTDYLNTNMVSDGSLEDTNRKLAELGEYQRSEKPPRAAEKLDLEALLQSLALKLRQANRPPFVPEVSPATIEDLWTKLEEAERLRLQALNDEAARLGKLKNLLSRFERKAAALEAWDSEKGAYLAQREDIHSLSAARSGLKIHDAYEVEKSKADPRLTVVQQLGAEIVALNAAESPAVQARSDAITTAHGELNPAAKAKSDFLWEAVEREEKKDALRKAFAEKAQAYIDFCKSTTVAVGDTAFGNDLEAVRAAVGGLDSSDAEIAAADSAKMEELKGLAAELTALGVTENKYTALTMADCDAAHGSVEDAKAARRVAYQDELARQEAMEAKRLEFAEAAAALMAAIKDASAAIGALSGEPDDVIAGIASVHQEGRPLAEQNAGVVEIDKQARQMRITSNPHTDLNVAKLRSALGAHSSFIKNFEYDLQEEKRLKEAYATRAAELMAWIQATRPSMDDLSALDNTLEGARAAVAGFTSYRSGEKGPKAALKVELEALCEQIESALSKSQFQRPAFVAPAGASIAEIGAAWTDLTTAEDAKDAKLQDELYRQERMAQLVRRFNGDQQELVAWVETQETNLARDEAITTVTAAQVQLAILAGFRKDYAKRTDRKAALAAYVDELRSLNYGEIAGIDDAFAEADQRFGALDAAATDKQAKLEAALAAEQQKESARTAYAKIVADYVRWTRDTADGIADTTFGFTLHEVQSFGATLTSESDAVTADNAGKKAAVDAAAARLVELDTVSTVSVTAADLDAESGRVAGALETRHQAYATELAHQQALEAKAVEFGEAAAAFVAWLTSQQEAIGAAAGTIDERAAAINGVYQDGAPLDAEFAKVVNVDADATAMGVVHQRSEYSFKQVEKKKDAFVKLAKSRLADLDAERAVNERAAAQAEAAAAAEHMETLRIDYLSKAAALNAWVDQLKEATSEPLNELVSVEGAAEQQALFDEACSTLDAQKKAFEEVKTLGNELTAAGESLGSITVETITSKYEESVSHIEDRRAALVEATAKQAANEELRKRFHVLAQDVDDWTDAKMAALAGTSSADLQLQLTAAKAVLDETNTLGRQKISDLEAANQALESGDVPITALKTYAALKAEYEAVVDAANKKVADVVAAQARAANSQITPEQLAEFTEVFNHFDKGSKGSLGKLEFKGCMQSLGEDLTDAQLDALLTKTDANGNRVIELGEFVAYMASHAVDVDSDDQIIAAFATVTDGADRITEAQMLQVLAAEEVEYLKTQMPKNADGSYDYKAWTKATFAN